jgi:hypothetical protein
MPAAVAANLNPGISTPESPIPSVFINCEKLRQES